ncbi:hypothetical protein [Marinitenerispora sediminis]|uniref:hypothetical protein n=1 Tax=Marinitenerispora sediminis TaxID=1931232 RepID=UPI0011C0547B|nr:hypothetical protein [Marinitenerispora sediminis]
MPITATGSHGAPETPGLSEMRRCEDSAGRENGMDIVLSLVVVGSHREFIDEKRAGWMKLQFCG